MIPAGRGVASAIGSMKFLEQGRHQGESDRDNGSYNRSGLGD